MSWLSPLMSGLMSDRPTATPPATPTPPSSAKKLTAPEQHLSDSFGRLRGDLADNHAKREDAFAAANRRLQDIEFKYAPKK